ncbi:MAG: glycosyltransferase [Patescibacteria group bacterium]|nr:glycosyltransferase [Patescibacteria group bacterium]
MIKEYRPNVVLIKNIDSLYSILGALLSRFLGVKKIIFLIQIEKFRKKIKSFSIWLVGFLWKASVITPLRGNDAYASKNKNLFYIPFVHEALDFNKEYFIGGWVNIICVGKFQERKNQILLVKAVEKLKDNFNINLTLVGERDENEYTNELLEYIKVNNLSEIVKVKFDINWKDVYEEYKVNDVFILPSYGEAAAFSIVEAMSCKLAVISSSENGTKEYIENGVNGYIFESKNLVDLIDKIRLTISDQHNLIKMGNAGFELIKNQYNPDRFYNDLMKILG